MLSSEESESLMLELRKFIGEGSTGIAIIARMDDDIPLPEITFVSAPVENFNRYIATIAACYLALDSAVENIANETDCPPEAVALMVEAHGIMLRAQEDVNSDITHLDEEGNEIL